MNQRLLLSNGLAFSPPMRTLPRGEKYTIAVKTTMANELALNSQEKFVRIRVLSCLLTARNALRSI
ncbi:hypothetical protein D3C77_728620 [compost metagenome]